jgi:hypothetical protein
MNAVRVTWSLGGAEEITQGEVVQVDIKFLQTMTTSYNGVIYSLLV